MIHNGMTWKHQLGGKSLAVCTVRRGCSKGELQVKRGWAFQHTLGQRQTRDNKSSPAWEGNGKKGWGHGGQFAVRLCRTSSSSGLSPGRPDLLVCVEGPQPLPLLLWDLAGQDSRAGFLGHKVLSAANPLLCVPPPGAGAYF